MTRVSRRRVSAPCVLSVLQLRRVPPSTLIIRMRELVVSSSRGRAASGEHANGTGTHGRGVESETVGGKQRAPYLPERVSPNPYALFCALCVVC